jgi:hypothetical protein
MDKRVINSKMIVEWVILKIKWNYYNNRHNKNNHYKIKYKPKKCLQ